MNERANENEAYMAALAEQTPEVVAVQCLEHLRLQAAIRSATRGKGSEQEPPLAVAQVANGERTQRRTNRTHTPPARMVPLTATSDPSLYAALDYPRAVRFIQTVLSDDAREGAEPNGAVVAG